MAHKLKCAQALIVNQRHYIDLRDRIFFSFFVLRLHALYIHLILFYIKKNVKMYPLYVYNNIKNTYSTTLYVYIQHVIIHNDDEGDDGYIFRHTQTQTHTECFL